VSWEPGDGPLQFALLIAQYLLLMYVLIGFGAWLASC